ncbi:MAG: CHAD domain-containing protein [Rhodanobacteraceae bacterium]|jgi:CHAD domain-containing protein|nr:CHAD domain-containing protein [Rhodanobacteraceae bacterium]
MARKSTTPSRLRASAPTAHASRRRPRTQAAAAATPAPSFIGSLIPLIRRNADELLHQRAEFAQRYGDEALHRLRVALRRLQIAAGLLAQAGAPVPPAGLLDAIGALRGSLGACRDADVLLRTTLPEFVASDAALAHPRVRLRRRLTAWRADLHRNARQAILQGLDDTLAATFAQWLDALGAAAAVEAPAGVGIDPRAAAALERRFRRLRRHARHLRDRRRVDLHACRIAAKKLRYTLDALAACLPRTEVARWTTALAALQDELGRANDARAGRTALRALALRAEDRAFVKAHKRWARACLRRRLRRGAREWRHLKALPRFWRGD